MKPKELLENIEESCSGSNSRYLFKYFDKDCVVAYNKNKTSVVMIINTAKTYMSFYCITRDLESYMFNQIILRRINLQHGVNLIEGEGIILNQDDFTKVKKTIILQNLK